MVKFGFLALAVAAVAIWFFVQRAPRDVPVPGGPQHVEIEAPNPFD